MKIEDKLSGAFLESAIKAQQLGAVTNLEFTFSKVIIATTSEKVSISWLTLLELFLKWNKKTPIYCLATPEKANQKVFFVFMPAVLITAVKTMAKALLNISVLGILLSTLVWPLNSAAFTLFVCLLLVRLSFL